MHPGLKVFTTSKNKTNFFLTLQLWKRLRLLKTRFEFNIIYISILFFFFLVFSSDNLVIFFFLLSRLGFGITKEEKSKSTHRYTQTDKDAA